MRSPNSGDRITLNTRLSPADCHSPIASASGAVAEEVAGVGGEMSGDAVGAVGEPDRASLPVSAWGGLPTICQA